MIRSIAPSATSMMAKNLADGKTLWTAVGAANYMKSPDLFVADGLVWSRDLKGRDPKTGEVVRSLTQEMNGPMSHDRCYRNRITHRYYLNSASGGTDFLKLDGKAESPNPWARSTCGLAVMPANGMVYNGPYVCQCAIGTMVTGVNGLYNGSGNSDKRFTVTLEPRLVKGTGVWAQRRCRRHVGRLADLPLLQHAQRRHDDQHPGSACHQVEGRYRIASDRAGGGWRQRLCRRPRRLHPVCAGPGERGNPLDVYGRRTHRQPANLLPGPGLVRQPRRLGLLPAGLGRPVGVEVQRHARSGG